MIFIPLVEVHKYFSVFDKKVVTLIAQNVVVKLDVLVLSETYYYIDLLKGDETSWDDWYRSSRSWTWQTSGNQFPANDANQNWNNANWDKFVLYVPVRLYT